MSKLEQFISDNNLNEESIKALKDSITEAVQLQLAEEKLMLDENKPSAEELEEAKILERLGIESEIRLEIKEQVMSDVLSDIENLNSKFFESADKEILEKASKFDKLITYVDKVNECLVGFGVELDEAMSDKLGELENKLNTQLQESKAKEVDLFERSIEVSKELSSIKLENTILTKSYTKGLTVVQVEKLKSMTEGVSNIEDVDGFVDTLIENNFSKQKGNFEDKGTNPELSKPKSTDGFTFT